VINLRLCKQYPLSSCRGFHHQRNKTCCNNTFIMKIFCGTGNCFSPDFICHGFAFLSLRLPWHNPSLPVRVAIIKNRDDGVWSELFLVIRSIYSRHTYRQQ
jgi:hypothetical protein